MNTIPSAGERAEEAATEVLCCERKDANPMILWDVGDYGVSNCVKRMQLIQNNYKFQGRRYISKKDCKFI